MTEKQITILNETLDYLNNYPAEAKALIVGEAGVFLGTKTTVMCITLTDGWEIVGMSSPLDKNDFNNQLGMELAKKSCYEQLLKYLEESKLSEVEEVTETQV
jgi:hypothetical protein